MAITAIAAGLVAAGTTDPSAAVGAPTGYVAGDLDVLIAHWKDSVITASTPAGFTLWANVTGGSGVTGVDTGLVRLMVWYRVLVGGETDPTIDFASAPNAYQAVRMGYRKAAGETWNIVTGAGGTTTGSDTTGSATSYSVTGAGTLVMAVGDWVMQATSFNGDAGTPGATTWTFTAGTVGSINGRVPDIGTTQGGDLRFDVSDRSVTGAGTGTPTYSRVWTSGNAAFAGCTFFGRLRVTAAAVSPRPRGHRRPVTQVPPKTFGAVYP